MIVLLHTKNQEKRMLIDTDGVDEWMLKHRRDIMKQKQTRGIWISSKVYFAV